jgi:putative ubiquitin-RnfH superfamily antitoxin RatB of RatAB toxin-antitoxin module
MIEVKTIRVPGSVQQIALEDGATVGDALDVSNLEVGSNEQITVNGSPASTSTVLNDGDRVLLTKAAKSAAAA